MTLADIIILIGTVFIISFIMYRMFKNKASICDSCAYLKHCKTGCDTYKKEKNS